jgi:hypothetical protein
MQDHAVARFEAFHAGADSEDGAGAFMPKQVGQEFVGAFGGVDFVDLGAADAAEMNADVNLSVRQIRGRFKLSNDERFAGFD